MKDDRLLISEAELAAWIRRRNLAIAPASPLSGLSLAEPAAKLAAGQVAAIDDRMAEAVRCVARAEVEYGVRLSTASGVVTFWFYKSGAGSGDLVGHFQDAERNHLFVWTDAEKLRDQFHEKLLLDENIAGPVVSAELSADGFTVLLAAIDLWRQRTLSSLLARDARPAVRFEATELMDCLDRTLNAGDARWLCAMAEPVCPFAMALTETSSMRGVLELERAGLLRAVDDLWEFTSVMDDLSAAMSVPVALGTLFSRTFVEPRTRRQLTAFRGMGRLCVAVFNELDAARPKLVFEDSSWPDLDLRLADLLDCIGSAQQGASDAEEVMPPPVPVRPSPGTPGEPEITLRYCTNCGRAMVDGNPSCSACGAPAGTTAEAGGSEPPGKKRHGKLWWLMGIGVIILLPLNPDAKVVFLLFVGLLWGITALLRKCFRKQ